MTHRSTICFCNSRALAERLTNHLNTLYHDSADIGDEPGVIARTHHGSISKAMRAEIEDDLKAGRLRCVVATNSLELGIDMGAVDLVIQVGAPPSVASGLQRIGRGGHQVSAVSHGVLLPLSRGDLLTTAVVCERMAAGQIERTHRIVNPLDVLAQHLVSMCLDAPRQPAALLEVIRGADCFADLPEAGFDAVVDMLTGKYPSEEFAELRPRLVWDHQSGTLSARPGGRRLVTTSGGTIPDRGLFPVFMSGAASTGSGKRAVSYRVGELDEEMVNESRIGDVFTLGTSAWRIEEINPNQVVVTPVPGQTGKMPFWRGDEMSRSAELGRAIQRYVGELSGETVRPPSLDESAHRNLVGYVRDQMAATGVLPDASTIVVERHRDEIGAWRVCIHCQLGRAVLQPWAMAIQSRLREAGGSTRGQDIPVLVTDDGITLRLGEVGQPSIGSSVIFDSEQISQIVARETQHSALFASRFRQCAARALLLPRRDPGKRSPLWQQRLRSAHLLTVASAHAGFPIIAEAMRECLDDVFDLESLRRLMSDIAARRVQVVEIETPRPSPFAAALLFGYAGAFLYDPDQPLAERAAAASLVDPDLLASLLGQSAATGLDLEAMGEVEATLQRLAPARQARTMESLWDMLRQIGPLTRDECAGRCQPDPGEWLDRLESAGRITTELVGGVAMVMVSQDRVLVEALDSPANLRRLVSRWARHHCLVTAEELAARYSVTATAVEQCLTGLADEGIVQSGRQIGGDDSRYIDAEVLARVRQHTVVRLRSSIQPVPQTRFASFLSRWHEVDRPGRGLDGLISAVEQLAGYPVPASMLETVVLPARLSDYQPSMLDEAVSSGEVIWSGHGGIGQSDGWICLWPSDIAPLIAPRPLEELTPASRSIYQRLAGGGAWSIDSLISDDLGPTQVQAGIWELVWAGLVSADTLAPLRALGKTGPLVRRPTAARIRRVWRPAAPRPIAGRWFAVKAEPMPATTRLLQAVNFEMNRYGIATKASLLSEAMTPSYLDAYRVLSAMESQGVVRRGYFVEGLGGSQFALPGAVDRLREDTRAGLVLLAACDPANPWGAGLAWPESMGHRPTRGAGALVVVDDGRPVIYLERGGHTLISFSDDPDGAEAALRLVGDWIDARRLEAVTLARINNEPALQARAWMAVLTRAGFTMTPSGFRRRAGL